MTTPFSCCTTRDGRAKATFTSRRAARAVAKRGSRYHHARLEEYRCEFDPTRWHVRDATRNARNTKLAHYAENAAR